MSDRYYPKQADLGWIFYNDENKSVYKGTEDGYWEHIRRMGRDDLKRMYGNFCQSFTGERLRSEMNKYADELERMSNVERTRENALMQEYTGMDLSTKQGTEFIKHFNEMLLGQEQFSAILNSIIASIDKIKKMQEEDPEKGKLRAPSQAVNFVSYFRSAINEILSKYETDKLLDNLLDDNELDKIVKEALNVAIDNMTVNFKIKDNTFGAAAAYDRLDQYLKNNSSFYEFVQTYLKIDDIKEEIKAIITGAKQRKTGLKINDVYKIKTDKGEFKSNEQFERAIGGLVHEFFGAGRMEITLTDKGGVTRGNSVKSNIGATDTITVTSKTITIDLAKRIEEVYQNAMGGETQKAIAYKLKQAARDLNRKKYSNLFVLHGSSKLYTMNNFRGFHKTSAITNIQELFETSAFEGLGKRFGHEIVSLYLNTTPGAVMSEPNEVSTIRDSLRVAIAAVAGQLLFSDWFMIGEEYGGPQQIHIFDLNGIIIPLSYVLHGLSMAMRDFSTSGIYDGLVTVGSFKTPLGILYPSKKEDRYGIGNEQGGDIDFNQYWIKQRDDARAKSKFRITFVKNFKNIITELAQEY